MTRLVIFVLLTAAALAGCGDGNRKNTVTGPIIVAPIVTCQLPDSTSNPTITVNTNVDCSNRDNTTNPPAQE